MANNYDEWLRLDNAAKIFPASRSSRWNSLFRCSAVLKSRVDKDILQEAVDAAIKRYPMFQVTLRKGVFWYYFQKVEHGPIVKPEENYPCTKVPIDGHSLLFRVVYSRNRISVEFFHALSDGYGGVNFLKTILLKYFHLQGKKVSNVDVLHYDDVPDEEEFEDSYLRYKTSSYGTASLTEAAAYHIKGVQELNGILNVVMGELDTLQLKEISKRYGVTINQYLQSVAAYVAYKRKVHDNNRANAKRPIKLQTAVNLRNFMPSRTLRNFPAAVNIMLEQNKDDKILTFEEVLSRITRSVKDILTEEKLYKFINSNTAIERNPFVRIVPLAIKTIALRSAFYSVGEKLYTVSLSNMGVTKAPPEFCDYVERIEFIIGPQKYLNYAIAVGTFNNKTVITMSRRVKNSSFEREFFRFLSAEGFDIKINANCE